MFFSFAYQFPSPLILNPSPGHITGIAGSKSSLRALHPLRSAGDVELCDKNGLLDHGLHYVSWHMGNFVIKVDRIAFIYNNKL
jgi:hypothetical protein